MIMPQYDSEVAAHFKSWASFHLPNVSNEKLKAYVRWYHAQWETIKEGLLHRIWSGIEWQLKEGQLDQDAATSLLQVQEKAVLQLERLLLMRTRDLCMQLSEECSVIIAKPRSTESLKKTQKSIRGYFDSFEFAVSEDYDRLSSDERLGSNWMSLQETIGD